MVTIIVVSFFSVSVPVIKASDDDSGGLFGFGDLFRSSDSSDKNSEPVKITPTPPVRAQYKPVLKVSLSEEFLNNVVQKYIAPGNFLTELYLAFNTKKNGIAIRGKVKLPKEIMAAYELPPEIGEIAFQSSLRLKITDKGHMAIIFPRDLTAVWPGSVTSPSNSDKIKIPMGFLEMAIARTRVYLATLSGDYSSYEREKAVIVKKLEEEEKRMATLDGNGKLMSELCIDGLKMEIDLLDWRIKDAKLRKNTENNIVKFVGEDEYKSALNLKARRNTLLVNPNLDKMFPFLNEVRIGEITFLKSRGSRYMSMTLSALIRE